MDNKKKIPINSRNNFQFSNGRENTRWAVESTSQSSLEKSDDLYPDRQHHDDLRHDEYNNDLIIYIPVCHRICKKGESWTLFPKKSGKNESDKKYRLLK